MANIFKEIYKGISHHLRIQKALEAPRKPCAYLQPQKREIESAEPHQCELKCLIPGIEESQTYCKASMRVPKQFTDKIKHRYHGCAAVDCPFYTKNLKEAEKLKRKVDSSSEKLEELAEKLIEKVNQPVEPDYTPEPAQPVENLQAEPGYTPEPQDKTLIEQPAEPVQALKTQPIKDRKYNLCLHLNPHTPIKREAISESEDILPCPHQCAIRKIVGLTGNDATCIASAPKLREDPRIAEFEYDPNFASKRCALFADNKKEARKRIEMLKSPEKMEVLKNALLRLNIDD